VSREERGSQEKTRQVNSCATRWRLPDIIRGITGYMEEKIARKELGRNGGNDQKKRDLHGHRLHLRKNSSFRKLSNKKTREGKGGVQESWRYLCNFNGISLPSTPHKARAKGRNKNLGYPSAERCQRQTLSNETGLPRNERTAGREQEKVPTPSPFILRLESLIRSNETPKEGKGDSAAQKVGEGEKRHRRRGAGRPLAVFAHQQRCADWVCHELGYKND